MSFEITPKLSTVKVKNLRLRAYIGFLDWEKEKLQDIVISFSFKYDTRLASDTDDVAHAVDYKKINKRIIELVDNKSFQLIENLAEQIYSLIQSISPDIQEIDVRVEKPRALRFADNVIVIISGKDRYNTAMITLGSNILPEENINQALNLISRLGVITKRTEFIKTKPLKFTEQDDFLNGAILLVTKKNLSELQIELRQIEAIMGRERSANKNAPRQIDLDVTTFNGFLIDKEIKELPFLIDFLKLLQPQLPIA
jgi:dihydroneopterin aldolase/2-amino-4-hydroxy-6-hydroxymethyldihydropteridine diphosphokinase